ncbi:protoporphyrinogen oxidase HemJ [Jiulongibacter sp. NS-SX5]|uniref:protoporphyrinogen oxidase HemJ n=1 Tax=Jiulongibacter sp. NS-SX5 TaxID=3463854 RepID=UPI004058AC81
MQYYLYFKAFHIVGFVSWFAGLFYIVRIFVYHAEADDKPEEMRDEWKKQFALMSERVYKIIMNPAMMITWTCGLLMLGFNHSILQQNWIKVKLVLLVLLTAYHLYCKKIVGKLKRNEKTYNSFQFRLLNELPTLFLVSIVLLAVLKDVLNFLYLFGGVIAFGALLYLIAKAYKKSREKNQK